MVSFDRRTIGSRLVFMGLRIIRRESDLPHFVFDSRNDGPFVLVIIQDIGTDKVLIAIRMVIDAYHSLEGNYDESAANTTTITYYHLLY